MQSVVILVSCLVAAASAGVHLYTPPVGGPFHLQPAASHAHGFAHAYAPGGYYGAETRLVDPVAIAAGAPLPVGDTYEVAAAKAAHFKAHAAAWGLAHGYSHVAPVAHGYGHGVPVAHGYAHAAPFAHGYAHAAPAAYGYGGHLASEARLVDPVAIAAGAPLPTGDTYEVAAAKAAHLKAHAAAKQGHHGAYYG